MASNFAFSKEDLVKNKALDSVQKLQELNNVVVVSTLTTKLDKDKLSDFMDAETYKLGHPSEYHYLNQSKIYELDGVSSAEEYMKKKQ